MVSLLIFLCLGSGNTTRALPTYADTIEHGFVFVDGEYMPAPYTLVAFDTEFFVNGAPLNCGRSGSYESFDPAAIGIALRNGGVLVGHGTEPCVTIRTGAEVGRFLHHVSSPDPQSRVQADEFSPDSHESWSNWLATLEPTEDFLTRANQQLTTMRNVRKSTKSTLEARNKTASMAYALTILGMLAGIWSFGHLMATAPRGGPIDINEAARPDITKATTLSILAVGILSTLDLVWTLMASQAGLMRELNPIGSRLMENPIGLVAFKIVATLIGCGMLFTFRKDHRARKAAWWMCMVLTLLTFRWLIFGSMQLSG